MIEVWQAGVGILASATVVGGGAVAVVRHMLRADFVSHGQHDALERQVISLKERLGTLPSEHHVSDLTRRMGGVETGVAVVQTSVDGLSTGLKRVERVMDQMLQRLLQEDAR